MKSIISYIINRQWAVILVLVILAITVRLVIVRNSYVISSDGPVYIGVAQDYYAGNYKAAISHPYHPLYPVLMSVIYRVKGNWEWAGLFISILSGALAIIPLWFIGKRLFPATDNKIPRLAVIGCLFYIFHPLAARFSAEVLTSGLFMCILFFTVWMILLALSEWKYRYFFLAGVGSLLAYLTRPDGLVLFLVAIALAVLIDIRSGYMKTVKRRALAVFILILPLLVPGTLYIGYMYKTKGQIEITQKFSLSKFKALLGRDAASDEAGSAVKPQGNRYLSAAYIVASDVIRGAHIWVVLLILVYLIFAARQAPAQPGASRIIWIVFAVYVVALFAFAVIFGRISKRYTVPLGMLMVFFSAAGLDYLLAKMRLVNYRWAGVLLTLLIFSAHTFLPVGKDKIGQKVVGKWIGNDYSSVVSYRPIYKVISTANRIPYYARGILVPPEGNLIDRLREADYIVMDKTMEMRNPEVKLWPAQKDAQGRETLRPAADIKLMPGLMHRNGAEYRVYKIELAK